MNTPYDRFNSNDVAKILGVIPQTVTYWVRNGHMQAVNFSDGNVKARYEYTDEEVTRVQNLIKKYGKATWTRHSKEGLQPALAVTPEAEIVPVVDIPHEKVDHRFDIVDAIIKLQELKEELENIEAKRNQIFNEYTVLKEEVIAKL